MNFRHFCSQCNINFHRAVDFISHKHEKVKPIIEVFNTEKENDPPSS